jgi:hypothetical protein
LAVLHSGCAPFNPEPDLPRRTDHVPRQTAKPATLDRWQHEQSKRHRALLLYAMQGTEIRSFRAVARAMGCSEGGVRSWRDKGNWPERIAHHGNDADQYALDLYREHYLRTHGALEMPHVLENVVRPVGALNLDDPVQAAAQLTRQRAKAATGATLAEVEQAIAVKARERTAQNANVAERHLRLIDAALGLIAKKLKGNEIRVSVRDIPVLLEYRDRLVRMAAGEEDPAKRVVQSARVRYAKSTGQDVLQAMLEDAEECVLILGALQVRKQADVHVLAERERDLDAEAAG